MRGGAQGHLMRCDDGNYYVVKFQNNPQHVRILANEMLASKLARRLGLPAAPVEPVEVRQELIDASAELVIQLGLGRVKCRAGLQLGSRYPGHPAWTAVYDYLPDEQLSQVGNISDFAGMLVFDKWACNTNGRQAVFFAAPGDSHYNAWMVDQGFCFNAGEWNFPDAPLRGLYARTQVYEGVLGMESFAPWLARLERQINASTLEEIAGQIPPDWYEADWGRLEELLEQLLRRRAHVPGWILAARDTYRQPFPNWK